MQGLELAKRYYEEVGRPMLEREFPELLPRGWRRGWWAKVRNAWDLTMRYRRITISGAGFDLWLFSAEDYNQYGKALQDAYDRLPGSLRAFRHGLQVRGGGGRVGVFEIGAFYKPFYRDGTAAKELDALAASAGG